VWSLFHARWMVVTTAGHSTLGLDVLKAPNCLKRSDMIRAGKVRMKEKIGGETHASISMLVWSRKP
jgi:hypothetical protein